MNQPLANALRCMAAQHPTAWSTYLLWLEYAQNSLASLASGVSPIMAATGYPFSTTKRRRQQSCLSGHNYADAEESGGRYVRPSSTHLSTLSNRQTNAKFQQQQVWLSLKDLLLRVECRSTQGRQDDQPSGGAAKAPGLHEDLLYFPRFPLVESDLTPPAVDPNPPPDSDGGRGPGIHCPGDTGRPPEGSRLAVPCQLGGISPQERSSHPGPKSSLDVRPGSP